MDNQKVKIKTFLKEIEVEKNTTPLDILKLLNIKDEKIVAAKFNKKAVDLTFKIKENGELTFLKSSEPEGLEILRHSAAHVLAQAVKRIYPKAQLTIGPVVEEGFYYDIYLENTLTEKDIEIIEKEMKKIIDEDQPFERIEMKKKDAMELYKDNNFKREIIDEIQDEIVSVYYNKKTSKTPTDYKEFFDLCTGPHIRSTSQIKAFKILKIAGAYWRGDAKNQQLQRVYGTAFATKDELENYLKQLEEAQKRDHRKLGKELELIMFSEMAPGMVFFLPKGQIIREELENFLRSEQKKLGYVEVKTPIILNNKLWQISGHWDHYKENMYFTKIDEIDYGIKPMNCPGHMLIFANYAKSYRDLPLKIAEFGLVHRHELSGVLSGMVRVRAFTQDDAHIFCTENQIKEIVKEVLQLTTKVLGIFSFEYHAELSTRPKEYMGELETWNKAEKALQEALEELNIKYSINEGDGAFYGPKIDFKVKDAIGRVWQLSTCQLDFQMPLRFNLKYEGEDGKLHTPVAIHRAIYGSLERFIGILIEHYAGKFPVWLAPIQIILIPITDQENDFAFEIAAKLKTEGLRVEINTKQATLNAKIRQAQLDQIPYMIVIGKKEKESLRFKIRELNGNQFEAQLEEFIKLVKQKIKDKK